MEIDMLFPNTFRELAIQCAQLAKKSSLFSVNNAMSHLEFYAVDSFMPAEHDLLIMQRSSNLLGSPIYKPPALVQWSSFLIYDLSKMCWI